MAYNKSSRKQPIFERKINNRGPETDCALTEAKVSVYGSCLKAKIRNYKVIDSNKKNIWKIIYKTLGN